MAKRKKLGARERTWFVREWLVFKGLKQKDLVARTGFQKSQVSEWVNEEERWNGEVLYAFADAMGTEPGDLLSMPPTDPIDDEFSRMAAKLDHKQKERALRVLRAAEIVEGVPPGKAA